MQALESDAQSDRSHEVNQELDGRPFLLPGDKASKEHEDDAGLDRADEHAQGVRPEKLLGLVLDIQGHAEILVDGMARRTRKRGGSGRPRREGEIGMGMKVRESGD
jgi:hypothetical protein